MDSFEKRLEKEQVDLKIKIEKLNDFMSSEKYNGLPEVERLDLIEQNYYMVMYNKILLKRISRLHEEAQKGSN